jgi:hypothetical protein
MAPGLAGLLSLALLCVAGTGASAQHMVEDSGTVRLTETERTEDALVAAMVAP